MTAVKERSDWWKPLIEVALIITWAVIAGRQYLNFSPDTWLYGSDYPLQILDYYVWRPLLECGACVFWNGWVSGGWPAFGDFFGGHLHPLVMVAVLIFGPIHASKVIVVAGMALAGIAQWWLARVMHLGLAARLWIAGLAVVGGHLSGRMDMGLVIMLFSIACTSLVLAPLVEFGLTGRRRSAIWLGLTLGLAMISGQGYMQLGILFALAPASLILLWGEPLRRWGTRLTALLAGGLTILISAVNFLPLLRFWGNIDKAGDPYFVGAQPIPFIPLNMLIANYGFFTTEALQKKSFPAFYMNYIGWVPVILALLTIFWVPRQARRVWFFFIGAILLVYLASSGALFRVLVGDLAFLSGARHPALISPLSVPLVFGLAAWGLDMLVKRLNLPRLDLSLLRGSHPAQVPAMITGAVLIFSIYTVYNFSQRWEAVPISSNRLAAAAAITSTLESESTAASGFWVQYPTSDLSLATLMVEAGYKVNIDSGHRNAGWSGRSLPPAFLSIENGVVDSATQGLAGVVENYVSLVLHPENQYAQVVGLNEISPCVAESLGGNIDVTCNNSEAGRLVVYENMIYGWQAWRDGERLSLVGTDWLTVEAPAGEHHYRFRYRPWDAMMGLILSMLGFGLAAGFAFLPDTAGHGDTAAIFVSPPANKHDPSAVLEIVTETVPVQVQPILEASPEAPQPENGGEPAESADIHVHTSTYPAVIKFVHVDIELELPDGTEAVIDITCHLDGQFDIEQEG